MAQLPPAHDFIHKPVASQKLRRLEILRQLLLDGPFDDPSPRKPDEGPGLCQDDVPQGGKAGGDRRWWGR